MEELKSRPSISQSLRERPPPYGTFRAVGLQGLSFSTDEGLKKLSTLLFLSTDYESESADIPSSIVIPQISDLILMVAPEILRADWEELKFEWEELRKLQGRTATFRHDNGEVKSLIKL